MIINNTEITNGLIVRKKYADLILAGLKTWELRSTVTSIRGTIAIIISGSGLIYGTVDLLNSFELLPKNRTSYLQRPDRCPILKANQDLHQLEPSEFYLADKWNCVFVLENAKRLDDPIPYKHPQGAVVWVKL